MGGNGAGMTSGHSEQKRSKKNPKIIAANEKKKLLVGGASQSPVFLRRQSGEYYGEGKGDNPFFLIYLFAAF